jgi:hypothetical protein
LVSVLIVCAILMASSGAAMAEPINRVWFSPAPESPDLLRIFSDPGMWSDARKHIKVFEFGPRQVELPKGSGANTLYDLKRAKAFQLLREWGLDVAIEAPSVKEWDCSGRGDTRDPRVRGNAKAATLVYIKNVHEAGGSVRFVAMDEPLVSGLVACKDSIEVTAANTAGYAKSVIGDANLKTWAPSLSIGDIEAYPSRSLNELRTWVTMLGKDGFKPAFFHLDVDVNDVRVRGANLDAPRDLRAFKAFFRDLGIPFGVIFWSGNDPESSDRSYYEHTLSWVRVVGAAIGEPDELVFQSWVRRSSRGCIAGVACTQSNLFRCGPDDPPYCNHLSVPINLPDDDSHIFSHTRLINDSIAVFEH